MVILGINYMFHDSSACILKNGELIVALEEERFTRNKHDVVFPHKSIEQCLKVAKLSLDDIDHVALSFKPTLDLDRKIAFWASGRPEKLGNMPHNHSLNTDVQKQRFAPLLYVG